MFRPIRIIHVDHDKGQALGVCGNTYLIERSQYADFDRLKVGDKLYVSYAGPHSQRLARAGAVFKQEPKAYQAPTLTRIKLAVSNG